MNQIVQLAITTANQGDKNKAMEYIRQALASNAKDVDAWLVLSALVDQEDRKRQCLNRVLSLDPTNHIAREELLEMDRAAMGGISSPIPNTTQNVTGFAQQSTNAQSLDLPDKLPVQNISAPSAVRENRSQNLSGATAAPKRIEKPLVFRYPIYILAATYLFVFIFGCFSILAIQEPTTSLISCGLFLVTLFSVWIVSAKVEINETGISSSRMFGLSMAQITWAEIRAIKSSGAGQVLELIPGNGPSLKVTSQVSGYSRIVSLLQQRRPDLFNVASSIEPLKQGGSGDVAGNSSFAAVGAERKVFRKSTFQQFGSYLVIVPLFVVSVWAVFADKNNMITALFVCVICLFMMISPFFDVGSVKIEGNRIAFETLLEEKEFTAGQIKEVKIKTVRRRSRVFHSVVVSTVKGKDYSLGGFPEGTEIIYGFLLNWLNTYQKR